MVLSVFSVSSESWRNHAIIIIYNSISYGRVPVPFIKYVLIHVCIKRYHTRLLRQIALFSSRR